MDWTVRNVVEPRFDGIDKNLKLIITLIGNLEKENQNLKNELEEYKENIAKIEKLLLTQNNTSDNNNN